MERSGVFNVEGYALGFLSVNAKADLVALFLNSQQEFLGLLDLIGEQLDVISKDEISEHHLGMSARFPGSYGEA